MFIHTLFLSTVTRFIDNFQNEFLIFYQQVWAALTSARPLQHTGPSSQFNVGLLSDGILNTGLGVIDTSVDILSTVVTHAPGMILNALPLPTPATELPIHCKLLPQYPTLPYPLDIFFPARPIPAPLPFTGICPPANYIIG